MDSFLDIERNISILGTDNGLIYRIASNQSVLLYRDEFNSEVRAIRKIRNYSLIIAFMSGNIIFLNNYIDNISIIKIRNGYNSKYSRIYDLEILDNDTIYFSSNYGEIYKFISKNNNWESIKCNEFHKRNAIFCLDKLMDDIFVSCDYGGGVVIWKVKDGEEEILYEINTYGNIQCVACSKDFNRLAMVHRSGKLLIFQKKGENFELILEHEFPESSGKKIIYLENDDSFVFNTKFSLYKYLEGNLYQANLNFAGNVEIFQNMLYYLNSDNKIEPILDENFTTVDNLITNKLLNIGLIGHTGVGKSTLCDKFIDLEKVSDLTSTSHRKLWIYKLPNEENKYIFFNDIAGQLQLIPTLLPSLKKSDIIFALFKSNDSKTLEILEEYLQLLREQYHFQERIFLIRTFYNVHNIDSAHSDLISSEKIQAIINKYKLEPLINIDRDDIESIKNLKRVLYESINWTSIKDWILSKQQSLFIDYLKYYFEKSNIVISLTDICNRYEELDENGKRQLNSIGFYGFDRSAVRSLLLRYHDHSLIDVIKDDDDELYLISNSVLFRKIKVKFYQIANGNMGFVDLNEIIRLFSDSLGEYEDKQFFSKYIEYYDNEFLNSNTWLKNCENQRIFWYLIENESIENSNDIIRELKASTDGGVLEKFILELSSKLILNEKKEKLCNLELFIELLKINLIAEKLSKTNGYWITQEMTLRLYYSLLDDEESTRFTYYIFSDIENHDKALFIDNLFRFYFNKK